VHLQERQQQGIRGIHMDSLEEHLDQQQLQKLFKKVIQGTSACLDGPAPDHQVLAAVVLSRQAAPFHVLLRVHELSQQVWILKALQPFSLHITSCL